MNNEDLWDNTPTSNLFEEPSNESVNPTPPRKLNMGDDKDRKLMWQEAREEALKKLYRNDPLIREELNAMAALAQQQDASSKKDSIIEYDEQGNIAGFKRPIVNGAYATTRNQTEVMRAIRKQVHKAYGIED